MEKSNIKLSWFDAVSYTFNEKGLLDACKIFFSCGGITVTVCDANRYVTEHKDSRAGLVLIRKLEAMNITVVPPEPRLASNYKQEAVPGDIDDKTKGKDDDFVPEVSLEEKGDHDTEPLVPKYKSDTRFSRTSEDDNSSPIEPVPDQTKHDDTVVKGLSDTTEHETITKDLENSLNKTEDHSDLKEQPSKVENGMPDANIKQFKSTEESPATQMQPPTVSEKEFNGEEIASEMESLTKNYEMVKRNFVELKERKITEFSNLVIAIGADGEWGKFVHKLLDISSLNFVESYFKDGELDKDLLNKKAPSSHELLKLLKDANEKVRTINNNIEHLKSEFNNNSTRIASEVTLFSNGELSGSKLVDEYNNICSGSADELYNQYVDQIGHSSKQANMLLLGILEDLYENVARQVRVHKGKFLSGQMDDYIKKENINKNNLTLENVVSINKHLNKHAINEQLISFLTGSPSKYNAPETIIFKTRKDLKDSMDKNAATSNIPTIKLMYKFKVDLYDLVVKMVFNNPVYYFESTSNEKLDASKAESIAMPKMKRIMSKVVL